MAQALFELLASVVEAAIPPANARLRGILALIGLLVVLALVYLAFG